MTDWAMRLRTLFSVVNLAVAAAALTVLFGFPRYASYAVYTFLAWFAVSLTITGLARGTRSAATSSTGGADPGAGRPAPSSPGVGSPPLPTEHQEPPAIGFCIYCATDLPPGASHCPACQRAVRSFA